MSIKIDQLIRSKRKSISLEISQDAKLIVRAPRFASLHFINDLINEKSNWILKKLHLAKKKKSQLKERKFVEGEKFLLMGKEFDLEVCKNQKKALFFKECFKITYRFTEKFTDLETRKKIFEDWYKKEARKRITESVDIYSNISGLKYNKIRINSAKTRWGSCSHDNNLNFSWRLIMAPVGVIDYVVVHELAHIAEKNHSKKFWQKVESIFPDYKKYKKWLKDHGHLLKL